FFSSGFHFDETEPARAASFAVHDHLSTRHRTVSAKRFSQVFGSGRERQGSNVQILRHSLKRAPRQREAPPHEPYQQKIGCSEVRDFWLRRRDTFSEAVRLAAKT